jgi:hypothetical protein
MYLASKRPDDIRFQILYKFPFRFLSKYAIDRSSTHLAMGRLWYGVLERRSQRTRVSWAHMTRHLTYYLPPAHVCHPYPSARVGVIT